jgi:hypothetical protein
MPTGTIPPDQVLNNALAGFISAMQGYFPALLFWGTALLSAVVFCGLAYALLMAITNHDWFGMLMGMGWAFARVMIIYMLYQNFESIGSIFSTMGHTIGLAVSGLSPDNLTPSDLYSQGLLIINLLFKNRHWYAWFNLIGDIEFLFLITVTMTAWFAIATRYLFTIVEAEWTFIKGAVTVCFAAFPNTWPTLENWAVQMLKVGIRLIAIVLIVAIGLALAEDWTDALAAMGDSFNVNPIANGNIQMCEALLVLWAVWRLPQKADGLITSAGSGYSGMDDQSGKEVYDAGTQVVTRAAKALV